MGLDRRFGEDQALGDLAVRQPAADQLEDLDLALGQVAQGRVAFVVDGRQPVRIAVEQPARDGGREERVAVGDGLDGGDEPGRGDVLEQEPAGTGAQRLDDVLVGIERGQDEDPGVRGDAVADDAARRRDPVEHRHADVHHDDVGLEALGDLDALLAVGGLADDLDVGLVLEDHPEPGPHQLLVVDQDHPDRGGHRVHRRFGIDRQTARARGIRSAVGPASNSPP